MVFEPIYIPWALNTGTCIQQGDSFGVRLAAISKEPLGFPLASVHELGSGREGELLQSGAWIRQFTSTSQAFTARPKAFTDIAHVQGSLTKSSYFRP